MNTGNPIAAAIVLHPDDNVAVCRCNVAAGEALPLEGGAVVARTDVALGHKIARCFIPLGAAVVKYGIAIGSATEDIHPGDWVHLHNLESNYISSHVRDSGEQTR